jgi:glycerol-3-phosphate dehydrogenase (NAD(P)+)
MKSTDGLHHRLAFIQAGEGCDFGTVINFHQAHAARAPAKDGYAFLGDPNNNALLRYKHQLTDSRGQFGAHHFAGLLADATPLGNGVPLVVCAKGIDRDTGLLPAQTLEKALPGRSIAALSGPSFAADIVRGKPTAVTLAASQMDAALQLSEQLSGPNLRVYASDDLTGVELGGALKNVIAVAVGACRGMELGASAEAALITRGFRELMRIATALGARNETLMGLSGLGDLVLTCSSPQSRNFSYGMKLGQGVSTEGLPLAEGAFTAGVAARIAREKGIDAPLTGMVAAMVEGRLTAGEAKQALLARPLKSEGE